MKKNRIIIAIWLSIIMIIILAMVIYVIYAIYNNPYFVNGSANFLFSIDLCKRGVL